MADFNFSVFSRVTASSAVESVLADVLDGQLRDSSESDRWVVSDDGFWRSLTPRDVVRRRQGWKLHLSATVASAQTVLARSLPALLQSRSAFKFASTIDHVARLNSRHTPRGHSGKFLTIYPDSDEEAARLAEVLHQATAGLAGPRILSDRPYTAGSLVHYRYGAFVEQRRISNDGLYTWVISDPDGNPVEDRRVGRYLPPAWARSPFPDAGESGAASANASSGGVLIRNRFLVHQAIRHANKGGIYRAVDNRTGADAVIKEARPHVGSDRDGTDVRDLLWAEARALEKVGPLGLAPRLLTIFAESDHLFLAEEFVPGTTLRQWVLDRIRDGGWRRRVPQSLAMIDRLVALMDAAHRAGLILRDFNPNNIMVRPDGELRLVDLELAVFAAAQANELAGAGTPGYAAPEQMAGKPTAIEADYYSLGATICFVAVGNVPFFVDDAPGEARPVRERLAEWLDVRADSRDIGDALRSLILGLMDDAPEHRWTISEVTQALARARASTPGRGRSDSAPGDAVVPTHGDVSEEHWRWAVDGMVGHILDSMDPRGERLWPASCAHGSPDPRTVQLGAAGPLAVLTRHYQLTGDERLPEAIATAGQWICERLTTSEKRLPGLHFGDAGIAWSLYEAGRILGDDRLTQQALGLADTLPASWANPDITHGTAGIGVALLHFWMRTGDDTFLRRALQAADALAATARTEPGGRGCLMWGTPAAFESRLAGALHHGFAHGTAGVAYFLLAAASAGGRDDYLALACRAGEGLLADATVEDGLAQWGVGPGDTLTAPYWCHGSAGIGGFLIRLHGASGDDRFGKLAEMAAQAVVENSWRGVLGQCHGLAGNGEFLLDMAGRCDRRRYERHARMLAEILYASRAHRAGRVVFPDERGELTCSWADGMSGMLAFLLRLRYGSPRLWMVDSLIPRSGSW